MQHLSWKSTLNKTILNQLNRWTSTLIIWNFYQSLSWQGFYITLICLFRFDFNQLNRWTSTLIETDRNKLLTNLIIFVTSNWSVKKLNWNWPDCTCFFFFPEEGSEKGSENTTKSKSNQFQKIQSKSKSKSKSEKQFQIIQSNTWRRERESQAKSGDVRRSQVVVAADSTGHISRFWRERDR